MSKSVRIAIVGCGTVGGATAIHLLESRPLINERYGVDIELCAVVDKQLDHAHAIGLDEDLLTGDLDATLLREDIEIVIELIGGYSPARELVLRAIENGKHVVTANKALIALHGNEIFAAARAKGVMVAFEAAVAGGIPIIKALREGLAANRIEWIAGIINGTGNFILTEMRDKGRDFADVLAEAQRLGYAEADPTFDVEGIDAAHKLTILGSLAFGIPLQFDKTYTEGISRIEPQDVRFAEELGYRIKHLGVTRRTAEGIEMRVHPTLIPHRRLIANVDGVMNAVLAKGDAIGPTLYYGAGAGALPTASAVIADVVDVVRALTTDPTNRVPHLAFQPDELTDTPVLPIDAVETAFYLRITADDRPGVMASIAGILGEEGISIEAIQQKEPADGETTVPLIMLTHRVREASMNRAIERIQEFAGVIGEVLRIRMETLDG